MDHEPLTSDWPIKLKLIVDNGKLDFYEYHWHLKK